MQSFRSILLLFCILITSLLFVSSACSTTHVPEATSPFHSTPTTQIFENQPTPSPTAETGVRKFTVVVVNEYPHDSGAFTQGLVIRQNQLYESTGLYGRSSIRKVNLETGRVEKIRRISPEYFGEGIVIIDHRLIQITWKAGIGFVYDLETFQQIATFSYDHEGWGITTDGAVLYMSDGTNIIHLIDPQNFIEVSTLQVTENDAPITYINELEYIEGKIYANIWQTSKIAIIDPVSGQIVAWIDLEALQTNFDSFPREIDVLNGIAYNKDTGAMYVTGKLWPKLFEVEIVPSD